MSSNFEKCKVSILEWDRKHLVELMNQETSHYLELFYVNFFNILNYARQFISEITYPTRRLGYCWFILNLLFKKSMILVFFGGKTALKGVLFVINIKHRFFSKSFSIVCLKRFQVHKNFFIK